MSIIFKIPTQSRYIATSTIFTAQFNVPTIGRYNFNVVGNQNIVFQELEPNVVYLIERMSVGGTISEQDYLGSIDIFPMLTIKRSISNQIVYKKPFPMVNYADGIEIASFVHSDKGGDNLTLSFIGSLKQLPSMVGLAEVKIQVSLSIFAIDSGYFNAAFRDVQSNSMGQQNRV